jgi:DNA-binding transcriptional LysR family regulator
MLHARLLRYLDEVARCQSMRQAGERLNVAGSAVNRQILALEEQLGTKLFERHPHQVVLTAAGEVLIDHVRHDRRMRELSAVRCGAGAIAANTREPCVRRGGRYPSAGG